MLSDSPGSTFLDAKALSVDRRFEQMFLPLDIARSIHSQDYLLSFMEPKNGAHPILALTPKTDSPHNPEAKQKRIVFAPHQLQLAEPHERFLTSFIQTALFLQKQTKEIARRIDYALHSPHHQHQGNPNVYMLAEELQTTETLLNIELRRSFSLLLGGNIVEEEHHATIKEKVRAYARDLYKHKEKLLAYIGS